MVLLETSEFVVFSILAMLLSFGDEVAIVVAFPHATSAYDLRHDTL